MTPLEFNYHKRQHRRHASPNLQLRFHGVTEPTLVALSFLVSFSAPVHKVLKVPTDLLQYFPLEPESKKPQIPFTGTMHAKSDSDVTSSVPSSPRSPKRPIYYVQSPSRDSHDGDKSSTMQATPAYNTPTDSPSHPSAYGRHSRASSASRFSGSLRKGGRKRNEKGWQECNVIEEEGDYGDLYDKGVSRRCQILMGLVGFFAVFSVFCLIIWGASRPYKARIDVKSLTVHNFYFGEGSDTTGVPSKMLTMNCSVRMTVYNPATFFGIHVSSIPVNLMYSEITVATGQLKRYYQPRKSQRTVLVTLHGSKVPLYGAGASLAISKDEGGVPVTLVFEIRSRGNVVGKLVRSKHRRGVSCSIVIDSHESKPIKLKDDSCTYH